LPEALINFLALMGWAPEGEEEIFTMEQLIEKFSLDRVSKSPAVFDMEKLNHINGYYIRNSSIEVLTKMAIPYLQEAGYVPAQVDAEYEKWLHGVVGVARNYISYMAEITEHAEVFFYDEFKVEDDKALEALKGEQVPEVLRVLQEKVEKNQLHPEGVQALLKEICTDLNLGGKKVFMPIRAALTGKTRGPEMHDLIPLLGPERIAKRINNSMTQI
jgi:nondiscriminating glutamyl-tRNA synthetase